METKKKYTMTRREYMKAYKKQSMLRETFNAFMKNKLAVVGLVIFGIILFLALGADFLADYETSVIMIAPVNRLQPPSAEHLLGTDELGRDIFSRIIFGARISLRIGVSSVLLGLVIGGIVGSVAGYCGGKVDYVIMRFVDIFLCLPSMLLAIAIVAAFGAGESRLLIAIAISQAPKFARVFRTSILSVKGFDYVEAARALGISTPQIIMKHILVNAMGPIIVSATMSVAGAITSISGLSFLGMGIAPPLPEWGTMLSASRAYMRDYPHLVLAPGLAIFFTVFSFNLLGDGLRDALDPRLRQ